MVRQREELKAITSRRLPTAAWRFSPEKGRFGRLVLGIERGLLALAVLLIGLISVHASPWIGAPGRGRPVLSLNSTLRNH